MPDVGTRGVNLVPLLDAFELDVVYVKALGADGRFRITEWAGHPPRGLDEHVMLSTSGLGGYTYATQHVAVTNRYHADGRFEPQEVLVRSGLDHVVCCHQDLGGSVTLIYGANYHREISPVTGSCFSEVVAKLPNHGCFAPPVVRNTVVESNTVSARERTILYLVSHGFEDREIAEMLFVSPATIRFHLRHLQLTLHCRNRTHLATEALRQGLLS